MVILVNHLSHTTRNRHSCVFNYASEYATLGTSLAYRIVSLPLGVMSHSIALAHHHHHLIASPTPEFDVDPVT